MLESIVVRKIRDRLKARGAWSVKTHGAPMQTRGLPDILACYKGRFLAIEVKAPRARRDMTPLQAHTLEEISNAGGWAFSARSWERVEYVLNLIDGEDDDSKADTGGCG